MRKISGWPKCPQCRNRKVLLIEIWDATITWNPGEPYFNEGTLNPGDPLRVEGHCLNCDHRWRLRGVIQVQEEWFTEEE